MKRLLTATLLIFICAPATSFSQTISDYLIFQDIGAYKLDKPEKIFPGEPPMGGPRTYDSAGVIAGAGHIPDHVDKTYEVMYLGGDANASPTVQVTQHSGGDSDKWLLHEVEDGYRDDDQLNATVDTNVLMRSINGTNIYFIGIYGAKTYTWIANNNIVIRIGCSSCPNTKPEPLEIVQAYLTKFPSTITLTDNDLKSQSHSIQWIKKEMDRRLWLCDKWLMQLQLEKVSQGDTLQAVVKSMNVFLDYREKYYGVAASKDKNLLAGYLTANNGTTIKAKLTEYKNWWVVNKEKAISL